ncbi:4'-phosphopantetheinyl transferase family protein [Actinoplanes teichomyceticus]|uniref:4'-phosphopantetheinyl transferase EntD n=1 Tax=Actinoplanes teichomyceticus TaxID=1867 RepID=A0A561WBE7_ACTTI|nr:4'-phosphopantetheinyl transferase superfamily protein [Actinoplanes teichomyceticus]TWG21196.1 4'-phosphopantetheinyl transferase EntD [Actinoplanes teichomyceticus]GIF15017.1 4'-phosphopantetheinyl transferase [Actinoplanes teichomyceticus]
MLAGLLPPAVVAVEAFDDIDGEPPFPGEEGLVARAVEVRRREFVTARRCARQALAGLGHPPAPILAGPRREPLWPAGVVGSITHCRGFRAAAVARRADLAALGIDAEPHGPLPEGVAEQVTLPGEREHLARLAATHPAVHWDRLLFSAKESVYKAWFPLTGRWLGFEEARLTFDPAAAAFHARILIDGRRADGGAPLTELTGRFLVERGLALTALHVAS